MKLASFCVPGFTRFDPIGLEFRAKSKRLGIEQVYFWTAPYGEKNDRLFRWMPQSSSWKECPVAGLSEKKRQQLLECWNSQKDIGLWIAQSKRLAELNENLRKNRVAA